MHKKLYKSIHKSNNNYQGITLTNQAINQIIKLMTQDVSMLGLRITIKKSGCAGFAYVFEKVTTCNLNSDDLIFSYEKIKLFISPKIISFIDGSTLDFIQKNLDHKFIFINSQISDFCGCGTSFSLDH